MKVKSLSGGEKSRLLLARILKHGGNFLILDEPTNDLDLPTLRLLEEALLAFSGCVLVVSHDRYFLNRVCTGIIAFEGDGQVVYNEGDYEYYREKLAKRKERLAKREEPAKAKAKPVTANTAKPRKLTWKEKKELEGMEEAILAAEEEVTRIEGLFADPKFHSKHGNKTSELTFEMEQAKNKAAELYTEAAELGSIQTLFDLGVAYLFGNGVRQDNAKAVELFEKAAMQGHVMSRNNLGISEAKKGNYDRAVRHLLISAKMGHENSIKAIKDMFVAGVATKEQYTEALNGYQDALEEMKSHDRDEAKRLGH